VTPDYGKIDISINFPWSSYPLLQSTAKVGILAGVGGKTSSLDASISPIAGNPAVQFALNGRIGYFTWDTTATVTTSKRSSSSPVYYQSISGAQIEGYQCSGLCNPVVTIFKTAEELWSTFGWKVSLVFFSWEDEQPSNVFWDPKVGMSVQGSDSPSVRVAISLLVVLPVVHLLRWM